eukprot:GFUD01022639.1.p1 GENE.GFUD01022639.1~~GFUD01022639.1.p1  ORF type:complete len:156 (+),score=46.39 GFUD01022639.1:29-496(+)
MAGKYPVSNPHLDNSNQDTNTTQKCENCTFYATCAYCKDTPNRTREAGKFERNKMKAYSEAQQAQKFNHAIDAFTKMALEGDQPATLEYKRTKKQARKGKQGKANENNISGEANVIMQSGKGKYNTKQNNQDEDESEDEYDERLEMTYGDKKFLK